MPINQIASNADAMSILVIVFTALAAASLVPAVHRFLWWPVEVLIWACMIAVSTLRVTGISDPKVREATVAAAWAGGQLLNTQLLVLESGIRAWLVGNRFGIATIVVIVAGVDVLALALIRSKRKAVQAMPQVRLGEWFVIPRQEAEPVPNALVELDHRLAAATRHGLGSVAHSAAARAVLVHPFAHAAAHLLGPGPARLRMVKLALGFEGHTEPPSPTPEVTTAVAHGGGGHQDGVGRPTRPAIFRVRGTFAGRRAGQRRRTRPTQALRIEPLPSAPLDRAALSSGAAASAQRTR